MPCLILFILDIEILHLCLTDTDYPASKVEARNPQACTHTDWQWSMLGRFQCLLNYRWGRFAFSLLISRYSHISHQGETFRRFMKLWLALSSFSSLTAGFGCLISCWSGMLRASSWNTLAILEVWRRTGGRRRWRSPRLVLMLLFFEWWIHFVST